MNETPQKPDSDYTPRLATPVRPYPPDAPLVAVHEAAWEDAQDAELQLPQLQDALANANAYAERMPDKIADYLLTHVGGDESQQWQAGHNYAMREAARLVRERHFALDEGNSPSGREGLSGIEAFGSDAELLGLTAAGDIDGVGADVEPRTRPEVSAP